MRYLLPLCLFLAIGGFLWKGLDLNPKSLPSALINQPAPNFNLTTVEDPNRFVKNQILMGKVSLVNFWATWCVTCRTEHTVWMELSKKNNLFLIGVNYHDDLITAVQWLKQSGNPYQINLFDKAGKLGLDYGVYGTPETFVIDKAGIIRYRHVGPIDVNIWQSTLLPLIEYYANQ
jgi:cytochrome c biogenesis protein CcmG/thiol:disulfide interchange protein DsbE